MGLFSWSKADDAEFGDREHKALANENSGNKNMTRAAISARGIMATLRGSGKGSEIVGNRWQARK